MDLEDFSFDQDRRAKSSTTKILAQWTPEIEARTIELLNSDMARSDVSRTLIEEFDIKVASRPGTSSDYRGLNRIYEELLDTGKLDPSITKINKTMTGKYLTGAGLAAQDQQILDVYLENESKFKQKPASHLAKLFNEKYGLKSGTNSVKGTAISPRTVKRAFENAIAGNYQKFDNFFKGRELTDFILSQHAKIFPEIKKLDEAIKEGIKEGYLLENQKTKYGLDRLKANYAKKIGMAVDDPKLENNFISRIRKILNSYSGNNVERYEKELYNKLKAPTSNYIDSVLHKNLVSIASQAGKMSNVDMALALGLPKKDAQLLDQLRQGSHSIAKKYKLPLVNKGGVKLYMAGDHTDIKALMSDFPDYKKNFMRIAFIQDGLNTLKASYDSKILALKRNAEQGLTFDRGVKSVDQVFDVAYSKATGKPANLKGGKFDPKLHFYKKTGATKGGYYQTPFSGPLNAAEQQAGGRTIPQAIQKLQNDFSNLSGGYKLGGFNIENGKIVPQDFIQPRINERSSPVSMSLRETLNNIKFSEPGGKRITDSYLNVVDKAIAGPEGLTTKGRIDIIKRSNPQDLKGSGFLSGLRVSTPFDDKTSGKKIQNLIDKGYKDVIASATLNEGDICNILGMKRGGLAGGGCGEQMRRALNEAPEETITKLANEGPGKFKSFANTFLNVARKGGRFGAIAAGGAVAAGFVKQFMNDDPTTYLSNEEQQKNLLMDMVTGSLDDTPEESPAIGDAYLPAVGVASAAGTAAVAPSTIDAVRGGALGAKKSGITKTALKTLGRGLSATASPLGLLATEPLYLAEQVQQGDSLGEMATNPFNYLGAAFTGPATEFATKGGLNPMIAKTMRLGISPTTLKTVSRRFGLPGLALSAGISGYEMYQNKRAGRGLFDDG